MNTWIKITLAAVLFAGCFFVKPEVQYEPPTVDKKAQFALDMKACEEAYADGVPGKCELYGKIQYVSSFPDVKVQSVSSFPDIRVQLVGSFPDEPGKWQLVGSFPDYKVQMVDSFPDYKVQFVGSFPGCD